jgi:hypothetical protein
MSIRIIHKKSETTGSAPTITDLTTGEFGVNAADGDVFIRVLMDPAGDNTAGNQQILSVRRPLYADGGEITALSRLPIIAPLADSFAGTYNYNWYNGDFNG